MFVRLSLASGLALIVTLGTVGCGGSDRPPLAEASGVVTMNGKPVTNATVVFAPNSGERLATGETNEAGEFELFTFQPGDGAVIGSHNVTIVAREEPVGEVKGGTSMPGGPTSPKLTKAIIPKKYFDAGTSGLTAEVTEDGDNYFEFDLTK